MVDGVTIYRPVTIAIQELDANGDPKPKTSIFEIHIGSPGKPRVYRLRRGSHRRVNDAKTLRMVADAFSRGTKAAKATDERMARRRKRWWYRLLQWFHGLPNRLTKSLSWRSWFS